MGRIAGRMASLKAREMGKAEIPQDEIAREKARLESLSAHGGEDPKTLSRSLKELMWQKAGVVRHRDSLEMALQGIEALKFPGEKSSITRAAQLIRYLEFQNMVLISEILCRAALLRTESRGSHFRSDYPEEDNDNWLMNIVIRKQDGGIGLEVVPVSLEVILPGKGAQRD